MVKLQPDFESDRYGLHVRLVREEDAEFIVRLRTDPQICRYIHSTSEDVCKQKQWIRDYIVREKQGKELYFIFSKENENIGLARLYNIEDGKFTSGSWLSCSNFIGGGVLCDIISREIAFDLFPEYINYFDIRKENRKVLRYAKSYHPVLYKEDEENFYFHTDKMTFERYKQIYLRMAKI